MGHTASGPVAAALKRPRLEARAVVRIQSRNHGLKLSGRGSSKGASHYSEQTPSSCWREERQPCSTSMMVTVRERPSNAMNETSM